MKENNSKMIVSMILSMCKINAFIEIVAVCLKQLLSSYCTFLLSLSNQLIEHTKSQSKRQLSDVLVSNIVSIPPQ